MLFFIFLLRKETNLHCLLIHLFYFILFCLSGDIRRERLSSPSEHLSAYSDQGKENYIEEFRKNLIPGIGITNLGKYSKQKNNIYLFFLQHIFYLLHTNF